MFLVFIVMCATEFASHALAVRALDFFAQCRNFYKVNFLPFPGFFNQYLCIYGCIPARTFACIDEWMQAYVCKHMHSCYAHAYIKRNSRSDLALISPLNLNIVQVWVPLFFSAPLVDLPLVLVKTPPDQLAKVILVIIVGTIFSILSSSFIVEAIMRVTAPTQDTAQVPARINLDKAARFSIHLTEFKTGATPGVR
jgi:hypothetical protein